MKSIKKVAMVHGESRGYPVIVQEEVSGGYWVSCPVFEGCYSQGKTIDAALKNIQEAIALCAEDAPKVRKRYMPSVSVHMVHV